MGFWWRFESVRGRTLGACALAALLAGVADVKVAAQATPTFTPTNTPTDTPTFTPTNTPTNTPTDTPTFTPTNTLVPLTNTPTFTPTNTPIPGCALGVSPSSLPNGALGVAYSQQLTGSGGTPPYAFSLAGGSLPPGLSLAADGLVSGTPTAIGSFPFTARLTDAAQCVLDQPYTLVIAETVSATPPWFLLMLATMLGLASWLALRRRSATP